MPYDISPGAVYQHFMNLHGVDSTPHFTNQQLIAWLDLNAPKWREENYVPDGVTAAGQFKSMDDLLLKAMVASQQAAGAFNARPKCEKCHNNLTDATMKAVLVYLNDGDNFDAELTIAGFTKGADGHIVTAPTAPPPQLAGESNAAYVVRTGFAPVPAHLAGENDADYEKRTGVKPVAADKPVATPPAALPGEDDAAYFKRTGLHLPVPVKP